MQSSSRARRQEGVFVVEGVRLAEEALACGWPIELALHSADLDERGQALLDRFAARNVPLEQVAPHVMSAASDTETPQGILVVLQQRPLPLPASLEFVFIPDQMRDPGNLGSMLRSAAAAGLDAALLPPGTVDAFSPKVVRAGMGAHFRLPIHTLGWKQIRTHLESLQVYLAAAGAGLPYTQADFRRPLALIVGGEASGASAEAQALATTQIHIPMPGGGESLNAAVAAGVLLFEALRQRQANPGA
ncbi:MAG: RNA methyltransferase [Anaerolineales bacterium]|nr:RNA methyltransferase [Anaerolineales bacterium]